jgi:hypothetical protein
VSLYRPHTPEQMAHVARIKELKKQIDYVVRQKPIAFIDEIVEHNIYGEFWVYFEALQSDDVASDMDEKDLAQRLRMPMAMRWVKEKFWQEFAIGFKTGTTINWRRVCHGYISIHNLESWLHNKYFVAWLLTASYNIQHAFETQAIQAQMKLEDEYLSIEPYDIKTKTDPVTGEEIVVSKKYNPAKAALKLRAIGMVMDRHLGKAVVHQIQEVNKSITKHSTSIDVSIKSDIQALSPEDAKNKLLAEIQKTQDKLSTYKLESPREIPNDQINSTPQVVITGK